MENGGRNILLIDDDPILRDALGQHYKQRPVKFFSAANFSEGLRICARDKIDIVLLDPKLTDGKCGRRYSDILSYNDQTKIILTTAHPGFGSAVESLQIGAHAYVPKPFHMKEMDRAIATALRTLDLERVELLQNYNKRKEIETTVLVGSDPCLVELHRMIDAAANSGAPVIITGETGTGKALVARAIHYRSRVKNNPYVTVDCCALPADRIECELFGYDTGEYSGAISTCKGFFELAGGGTLFLDAIEELSLHLQSKLLAAVDAKKVTRLGGQTSRHIEARVIAATHIDLENAVRSTHFNSDLYDRFRGLRIHVPPLREHRGDVPELCSFFIETISPSNHLEILPEDLLVMMEYDWPGNVRELRNVIERSIMLRQGPVLRPAELLHSRTAHKAQLPAAAVLPPAQGASSAAIVPMKAVEKEHIRQALKALSHNHSQTAKALGISRSTLIRKMKAYGI